MRQLKLVICGLVFVLGLPGHGNAYDVKTHRHLSKNAYQKSDLASNDRRLLLDLGLINDINDPPPQFPNEYFFLDLTLLGKPTTISDLIEFGSEFEDGGGLINDVLRPLRVKNHFYNEQNGGKALTTGFFTGPPGNWPSPDWALEDTNNDIHPQDYSYHDALGYFKAALTVSSESERRRNWGRLFQTLGHVIHHVQDMAQPQHTRNDVHSPIDPTSRQYYEWYTQRVLEDNNVALPVSGYPEIDPGIFDSPRKFWDQGNGKGMAEFSSRNFVSDGTNFDGRIDNDVSVVESHPDFDFPRGSDARVLEPKDIQAIDCGPPAGTCPPSFLTGKLTFIETPVYDANTGQNLLNSRASSYGIFSHDLLRKTGFADFSLNRFNYDAAHEFLLPRAVSYSAGLIDYFFRGRLRAQVSLDGDGLEITNRSTGGVSLKSGGSFTAYYRDEMTGLVGELAGFGPQLLGNSVLASDLPSNGTHTLTGLKQALEGVAESHDRFSIFVVFDGGIGNSENASRGIATAPLRGGSATVTINGDDSILDAEIRANFNLLKITLLGARWVEPGPKFDSVRQNIIDGIASEQDDENGWNKQVRDRLLVSNVRRISDRVVEVVVAGKPYDVSANDFITVTVPNMAIEGGAAYIVASGGITVSDLPIRVNLIVSGLGGLGTNTSSVILRNFPNTYPDLPLEWRARTGTGTITIPDAGVSLYLPAGVRVDSFGYHEIFFPGVTNYTWKIQIGGLRGTDQRLMRIERAGVQSSWWVDQGVEREVSFAIYSE